MLKRIGFPVISKELGLTTNRTFRLTSASAVKFREVIAANLADLESILEHSVSKGWHLFRIGSSVIPFGSHPVNTIKWWKEFSGSLERIGQFAIENDVRLSMHPGQFTILNSPNPEVVSNAIRELDYSARFLRSLNLGKSHKVVIHLGGVYGDKRKALDRLVEAITQLDDSILERLVIENDERNYTPADAISVSRKSGLPIVFDNLHYSINPGPGNLDDLLGETFSTWNLSDGNPKVHFSSQASGARPGKHAEMADAQEFLRWKKVWSNVGDFDLMLEAKGKDLALSNLAPFL